MESLSKRPEGFLVKNLRDAGETKMKIELLYFDGCPSWQAGLENLKAALQQEGKTSRLADR
jgi:hypothetical protein